MMRFKTNLPTVGEISTDGEITLVEFSTKLETPRILFAKNITKITMGNSDLISAKYRCNIILSFDEKQKLFHGQVQGPENNSLKLKLAVAQAKVFDAKSFTFQPTTQTLQIDFDKPKPFRIEIAK